MLVIFNGVAKASHETLSLTSNLINHYVNMYCILLNRESGAKYNYLLKSCIKNVITTEIMEQ